MSILDQQAIFSDEQSIAAAAGNVVSTNSYDLLETATPANGRYGTLSHDLGAGTAVEVDSTITEAVLSAGAATVEAQIIESDSADLSAPTVVATTGAIPRADLVVGYRFKLRTLPQGMSKRYFGARYVVAVAATTAGKVKTAIVLSRSTSPRG